MLGGSQSSSQPVDMTPSQLVALRQPFANTINTLMGTSTGGGLSGIPTYNPNATGAYNPATGVTGTGTGGGAATVAPMSAGESAGLATLTAQGNDPTSQNYLNSVLKGDYLPGGANQNPFLQSAIQAAQRPTFNGLTTTLDQTLPGRFTQNGQFTNPQGSSAFDMAARLAARDAGTTAGDIAATMSSGAYTTERANQQQAVTLNQQQAQQTIATLQAEALPRLIQQYGIDQGLAQFNTRIQALMSSLATTAPTLTTIGNSSQSTTQPNILGTLLGAGGLFG
jgi:hypothetical protein